MVVRRVVFEAELNLYELEAEPGSLLPWQNWAASNRQLEVLANGGTLWAVTVRPDGRLWLVARYDDVRLTRNRKNAAARYQIKALRENTVSITDITSHAVRLGFTNRKPIDVRPKVMANSLQTPGILTRESSRLLYRLARSQPQKASRLERHLTGIEGGIVHELVRRRQRDAALRQQRLALDKYACQACSFSGKAAAGLEQPVVDVHHINPLKDTGRVRTSIGQLITLCPTCHRLVHALASANDRRSALHVPFLRRAATAGSRKPWSLWPRAQVSSRRG